MSNLNHLETKDINVWFGERHVLRDVSLQFQNNHVTALIGPSGCGKSTFIRTLNRMHELIPGAGLSGQVLLNGQDIYAEAVDPVNVRIEIGMVFQKPNPFPTMTIKENMTIVIVTHNMQQAQRVADSTAFFLSENGNPGEVVEFDTTENVFIRPKDERTNEYVNGRFG